MSQLSAHEASFLYADQAHANANVTYVQIYDQGTVPGGTLRFKTILAHIESRLHRSPVFLSKLMQVPLGLDEPYWVEDELFDLEHHVRHIALPKPGDWRQFCIQASRIHARALDPQRPLWEIYVVEGLDRFNDLPPGSFALLTKIHHAAIDVESRNAFVEVLHDTTRRPPRPPPPEPWFAERAPGLLWLLGRAALHTLCSPRRLLAPLQRAAPTATAFLRDLLQAEPIPAATRFNAVVTPHRVFDMRRLRCDEVERIRALVPGATVTEVVLAVCAGGLRRYLQGHAELPQADLSAIVPADRAAEGGSGAAARRIGLGTNLNDPLQRLSRIHGQLAATPDEAGLLPPACTITELPAPAQPVYLHGARLTCLSAMLPIADGMGLVFAVTAYDGRIVVSPTSCRELMPDPQTFAQALRDSYLELLARTEHEVPARRLPRRRRQQPVDPARQPGGLEAPPDPFGL